MRTSHLDDGRGNTICGYPWESWQDGSTRVTLKTIEEEPHRLARLELIKQRHRQLDEDGRGRVRMCPACFKLGRSA